MTFGGFMTIFVVTEEYGNTYTGYTTFIHKAFHNEQDALDYINGDNATCDGTLDYYDVELK